MATRKRQVEPSKELELLNFRAFMLENPEHFVTNVWPKKQNDQLNVPKLFTNYKISTESKNENEDENNFLSFQKIMKIVLIYGQCLGLNPVTGIFEMDLTKMRYRWLSWQVFYSLTAAFLQMCAALLCLYRFVSHTFNVRGLSLFSFIFCTSSCTLMFFRVAVKWPSLMKELYNCGLHQYNDPKIKLKCHLACYIFIFVAIVEYVLSQTSRYVEVINCSANGTNFYENYVRLIFPWAYEMTLTTEHFMLLSFLLQVLVTISTFIWSYPDIFTICISIYLRSILHSITKRIESANKNNYLPPSFWRSLREDYNRATQLVRSFDDSISGVVFISFANNMFFICLQLYYSLANGLKERQGYFTNFCPNYPSGPFGGYEATIYLTYSLIFLLSKFLAVSLITSSVHTASMKAAPALYNVASSMYCEEIQRFLDQVHSDTVALSGFQFFYVTRDIILSVAGTIVTYELVMLQFTGEDSN